MKKILAVLLAVLFVFSMVACSETKTVEGTEVDKAQESIKVGVICIGDENEGYTEAHIKGVREMAANLGLNDDQIIFKYNISEYGSECKDAASELADEGCAIIFGNSFGFEDQMYEVAKEYPDVEFCHATGYKAATSGLENTHNYFAGIYEARYVAGVVAGLKLQEMIDAGEITAEEAKMGYVGAFPYAEVKSGFTAFYLGAKSIVPTVTMEVKYTNSWSDMAKEKEVADALIDGGCVLISQHADTTGAPSAAEAKGVPCVGYNISMIDVAPTTALTSSQVNWGPYYTYAVKSVMEGTEISVDWCEGYADGAVRLTELNEATIAEGTAEKVAEVEEALKSGELKVFDIEKWTVGGEKVTSTVNVDGYYGLEYIIDGAFAESELASAPSFAFVIDGITELQ